MVLLLSVAGCLAWAFVLLLHERLRSTSKVGSPQRRVVATATPFSPHLMAATWGSGQPAGSLRPSLADEAEEWLRSQS